MKQKEDSVSLHFRVSNSIGNLTEQEKSDLIHFLWGYSNISTSKMHKFVKEIKDLKDANGK